MFFELYISLNPIKDINFYRFATIFYRNNPTLRLIRHQLQQTFLKLITLKPKLIPQAAQRTN